MCLQIVGANKGGVVAVVEGLRGFVPFSQISTVCVPLLSALYISLSANCDFKLHFV